MQTRLRKLGYDVGEVDGRVGETLRAALRAYQEAIGATPDGYPTLALLAKNATTRLGGSFAQTDAGFPTNSRHIGGF